MNLGDHLNRLHKQGDNYKQMVVALRAIANEILFDETARRVIDDASVRCGRTMRTSARNKRSPNNDVTPDMIIQTSSSFGVVAECKWGVPRDPTDFSKSLQEIVEQLEKYDDDLVNWPGSANGAIATHDLVLIVNHEDSKTVTQELKKQRENNALNLTRNFAIVGVISHFQRATGVWTELDLEEGALSDTTKTAKLSRRIYIDPAKLSLNPHVSLVELCDTQPPIPVMMEVVYKALNGKLSREQHEQRRLDGKTEQSVTLTELLEWVGRFAFPQADKHDAVCPREEWLRDAMTAFVAMKWAEQPDPKAEEWVFLHQRGRKLPYERFTRFCARRDFQSEVRGRKAEVRAAEKAKRKRDAEKAKAKAKMEREAAKEAKRLDKAIADAPLFADQLKKSSTASKKRGKKS